MHAQMLPKIPKMLNSMPNKDVKSSSTIPNGTISWPITVEMQKLKRITRLIATVAMT